MGRIAPAGEAYPVVKDKAAIEAAGQFALKADELKRLDAELDVLKATIIGAMGGAAKGDDRQSHRVGERLRRRGGRAECDDHQGHGGPGDRGPFGAEGATSGSG